MLCFNNHYYFRKRHELAIDIANRITPLLPADLGASVFEDGFINFSISLPNSGSGPSTHAHPHPHAPTPAPVKSTPASNSGDTSDPKAEVKPHKFSVNIFILFIVCCFIYKILFF